MTKKHFEYIKVEMWLYKQQTMNYGVIISLNETLS